MDIFLLSSGWNSECKVSFLSLLVMNVCLTFHRSPSNRYWDISVQTNVADISSAVPRATQLSRLQMPAINSLREKGLDMIKMLEESHRAGASVYFMFRLWINLSQHTFNKTCFPMQAGTAGLRLLDMCLNIWNSPPSSLPLDTFSTQNRRQCLC